jgi:hypothetical protein
MKKKKLDIEVGQCYSYHDRVFMVVEKVLDGLQWGVQDTLTKEIVYIPNCELLTWSRPFPNWG